MLKEYNERYQVELVTPEQAMEWIAASWGKNGRNFYPTEIGKIKRYAQMMRSGEWKWIPGQDSVKLKDGVITDGRHRLHAILLSGQTVKCTVKYKTSKEH